MVFLGVYRAIYDYAPQSDRELEITEGDLLFVLEKGTDDDWWKAKKKAMSDEEDEPEGLIPNNYIEQAQPTHQAKALYDYAKQTDEELSFHDEARLDVYDTTDPDWTLVGLNGEYGFAPAIYIETASAAAASAPAPPAMPARSQSTAETYDPDPGQAPIPSPIASPTTPSPAAALAGIIAQRTGQGPASPTTQVERALASPPLPQRPQYTPDESEEDVSPPRLPQRPASQTISSPTLTQYASPRAQEPPGVMPSPPYGRDLSNSYGDEDEGALRSPSGYHMYNVHEMISHIGKNKKMPTTLGINVGRGIIMISPEKTRDGPQQEWTADKLTHYSIEGKHVFVELVRPSKSVDFHAGAKDTAQEIVAYLGELAGAVRAEGLREVLAASAGSASGGQKKGQMLYEFMAQGDDEVTVAVGDEVIILDDGKSKEWWMVRRLKNGKEGVVPSDYVEVIGTVSNAPPSITGLNAARSTVEQNRLEEERLAKHASKNSSKMRESPTAEVGPGMALPERHSSLAQHETDTRRNSQRGSKRESRADGDKGTGKSSTPPRKNQSALVDLYTFVKEDRADYHIEPNTSRIRMWTDRTGSFKVEAEFIGLRDGKIHLHKLNGVKIAVPVSKMAIEDLEYVENATGVSLDEDKPLSDIKRRGTQRQKDRESEAKRPGARVPNGGSSGAKKDEYDWFDFFLQCGVNPQICERYASAFSRDQMGQEVLPEVNDQLLRTLGLKEGDILRVMKFLDDKYGRNRALPGGTVTNKQQGGDDSIEAVPSNGSLFSGPTGALRNNTRKGRPAPAVQTNDVVSEDTFKQREHKKSPTGGRTATPLTMAPQRTASGFDDDAWDVKPARITPAPAGSAPAPAPLPAPAPKLNDDLSLLALPLQPTPTGAAAPLTTLEPAAQQPSQPTQRQGADQSVFDKIAAMKGQQTSLQQQQAAARQVPLLPVQQPPGGALGVPPPLRASSAPGFAQPNGFGAAPLQPQLTGFQPGLQQQQYGQQPMQMQQTGFPGQQQAFNPNFQQNGIIQQPTGFLPQQQFQPQQTGFQPQFQQQRQPLGFQPQYQQQPQIQQQLVNGQQTGSPFADPPRAPFQPMPSGLSNSFSPQQSGFQPQFQQQILQPTGLPPTLQPLQTGFNGYGLPQLPPQQTGGVFGPPQQFPQAPPIPQLPIQALQPQKTGPAPPVRFGVQPAANKLMPQPTGRANLAKATPQNPFGF